MAHTKRLSHVSALDALSGVVPQHRIADFVDALREGGGGYVMATAGAPAGALRQTWERRARKTEDPNVIEFARNLSRLGPDELVQAYTAEIGEQYFHLRVVVASQNVVGFMRGKLK